MADGSAADDFCHGVCATHNAEPQSVLSLVMTRGIMNIYINNLFYQNYIIMFHKTFGAQSLKNPRDGTT